MAATRRKKGVARQESQEPGISGVVNPDSEMNKGRLDQMAEIAEKNAEERRAYNEYHGAEAETSPETPPETPPEPAQEAQPEPEPETPPAEEAPPEQPEEKMVTLKVDGKEEQRTEGEVFEAGRRALQKESAADKRLQEATELLRQAQQGFQAPQPEKKSDLSKMDDRELARRIQMGTEDEAAEAVAAMRDRENVSSDDIGQMVENRVLARLRFEEVRKDFADVLDDDYLSKLAVMEDQRMVSEGDTRMPHERLPEIAKHLREWRGQTKPEVKVDLKKREEQKAQAGSSIPAASGRQPAAPPEKPPTRAEILDEMRKSRGQLPIS